MIVQGDVFFTKAMKLPEGAKLKRKEIRGYVIAEGEATGHAHVVEDEVELYEKDGILYVKTEKEVRVKHPEHKSVTLAGKTIYQVGIVRQYDYFSDEYMKNLGMKTLKPKPVED